jgi:UDP-3-O-[3-hydroxymyristoyl] glucosamine N-acyltransferase
MRRKQQLILTLPELARRLGAQLELPAGQNFDAVTLNGLSTLECAQPHDLAFVGGERYRAAASQSQAGALLVTEADRIAERPCLVVPHVWKAALAAFDLWYPDIKPAPGIHPSAVVDPAAQIHPTASIGPLTVVEAGARIGAQVEVGAQCFIGRDVQIGDGTLLHPAVRLLERVQVGRGVIIHSGAVLGSDGFGYEIIEGRGVKIPQVGTIVVEDEVEIGANTTIDRAFLHTTRIGAGSKIDNLVQIAHNVQIGRCCGLASQVGVAGSTVVGDGVIMWGQVGVPDHIRIGDRAVLLAKSGPKDSIPAGETYFGTPAIPVKEAGRQLAAVKRLPDTLRQIKSLERQIEKLIGEKTE